LVTLLDIYGQTSGSPETKPVEAKATAEAEPQPITEPVAQEQVWEFPIGYALATAAAAWIVHALLMRFGMAAGGFAIIWPLNGVTAGLMLGKKRRDWPLILLFVSIATTINDGAGSGHWFTAVMDSLFNAVEVLIVLAILPPFESLQQWLRTPKLTTRSAVANFIAAPVAAGLLAATFYHFVWHVYFWHLFHQWALADALGLASTIPLVLALRTPASWSTKHPLQQLRSAVLLLAIAGATLAVFWQRQTTLEFVLFPALALVIFYCGFTGAMMAIELICCISVYRLLHHPGILGGAAQLSSHNQEVLFLQLFLGLIVLVGFSGAVLLAERRVFTARYRSTERQYRLLAECSRDVIVLTNLDGICRFVSPASSEVLGLTPEELTGLPFQHDIHEEDVPQWDRILHDIRLNLASEAVLTYRTIKHDGALKGQTIWVEGRLRATTDDAGDVNGAIITLRDITEHKRLQKQLEEARAQLEHQAAFDALTNVANRRRFDDIFDQEWRRAAREFQPMGLLLIDVDNFKDFNDTNGHQAGDECLRAIAQVMTTHAKRPGDLVARWGGAEFAILLPTTDLHGACEVADRIRRSVEDLKIHYADLTHDTVTVSIGVAAAIPLPDMLPSMLVEDSDRALYLAKANGRNRIEFKPGPRVVRPSSNTISFA
jgi:diguanylate cyclase (GGDEF)-like protein/PAS domain S-box-containing protein